MFCLVPCVLSSFSGNDPGIGCVPPCGYGIIIRSIGEYEPPHRGFRVFLILLWGVSDQSLYSVMDLIHGVSQLADTMLRHPTFYTQKPIRAVQ